MVALKEDEIKKSADRRLAIKKSRFLKFSGRVALAAESFRGGGQAQEPAAVEPADDAAAEVAGVSELKTAAPAVGDEDFTEVRA